MNTALRWKTPKMAWWYWALIDEMVEHPELNKTELAAKFRVTPACIYLVTGSDLFKAHLEQRQRENAALVDATIRSKLVGVATAGLDILKEKMEKKRDTLGVDDLVSITDSTLQKLGYGVKPAAGVTVNAVGATQVVVPASLADIESARAALRAVEQQKLAAPETRDDNSRSRGEFFGVESESMRGGDILEATSGPGNDYPRAWGDSSVLDSSGRSDRSGRSSNVEERIPQPDGSFPQSAGAGPYGDLNAL